jgi:hypothetical protein
VLKIEIAVPRDRTGNFAPQPVAKGQTRFDGFDDKILSPLCARHADARDAGAPGRAVRLRGVAQSDRPSRRRLRNSTMRCPAKGVAIDDDGVGPRHGPVTRREMLAVEGRRSPLAAASSSIFVLPVRTSWIPLGPWRERGPNSKLF